MVKTFMARPILHYQRAQPTEGDGPPGMGLLSLLATAGGVACLAVALACALAGSRHALVPALLAAPAFIAAFVLGIIGMLDGGRARSYGTLSLMIEIVCVIVAVMVISVIA